MFQIPVSYLLINKGTTFPYPQTIWYLHSQTVCANLVFIRCLFSNIGRRINTVSCYIPKELFHKYYRIVFAILPGIAGGIALQLEYGNTAAK